jgi:hypothetical protein
LWYNHFAVNFGRKEVIKMAWVEGSVWDVSVSGTDKNGHQVRFSFNVEGTDTYTECATVVSALATAAQAISGVSFERLVIARGYYQDDPVAATEQGEDKALFIFRAATYPVQRVLLGVPGCPDSILQENLIDVDQTNEDVGTFLAAVFASVVTLAGEPIDATERAYLSQRRSLKRPGRRAG